MGKFYEKKGPLRGTRDTNRVCRERSRVTLKLDELLITEISTIEM